MIHYRGKDIIAIRYVENGIETAFSALYDGAQLIWELITNVASCFANGWWDSSEPWTGDEPWNSNY